MSTVHLISMVLTLLLVTLLGLYSLRRIKTASDFNVGGRTIGSSIVVGMIVGTLVGGASTIGTAQLAFQYGFSAWWFTLGAGIACLILGLFLAKPLRESGAVTIPGFLADTYGDKARLYASIFSSIGIFLNIVSQILAAVILLVSMTGIKPFTAAVIAIFLVVSYVVFGGVWSTGLVGIFKTVLLYFSMIIVGVLAYRLGGGAAGFRTTYEPFPWFSLFGRGFTKDLAAGFSLIVGVLSTQTYIQAMFSGKTFHDSRKGALISGIIIPPIGLAGIAVGLYMRAQFPTMNSGEALPFFIISYLPAWLGGIVIATLLISIIGTGAGLVLGISTMLSQDIFKKIICPQASDKIVLVFTRISIMFVSALTLLFVSGNLNSLILKWSFLSMGLRGAAVCFPLLLAIYAKGFVNSSSGLLAIAAAPLCAILWAIFGPDWIDPLYIGLTVSLVVLVLGSITRNQG